MGVFLLPTNCSIIHLVDLFPRDGWEGVFFGGRGVFSLLWLVDYEVDEGRIINEGLF